MSELPPNLSALLQSAKENIEQFEKAGFQKPEPLHKAIKRVARYAGEYPTRNLAVDICIRIWTETTEKAVADGESPEAARQIGKIAYCSMLPKLSGANNIRDFIACITHAMGMEIIAGNEGTRLLYAAQVAHNALTKRPKKRNQSSHTSTPVSAPTASVSAT